MKKLIIVGLIALSLSFVFYVGRKSVKYLPTVTNYSYNYNYKNNFAYQAFTPYYVLYHHHYDIVMMGNSMIQRINWNEFLERTDIANRGIGGDITEGILSRINSVLSCTPKTVFLEGGINDIANSVPVSETVANIKSIVDTLHSHNINTVIFKVIYVSKNYVNALKINSEVDELNKRISNIQDVHFIDMNQYISKDSYLQPQYDLGDGIHISPKGYKIWGREMMKEISVSD